MKALTVCQPFAELIMRGEKRIENRVWWVPYRGPLLIHAGKSRDWLNVANPFSLNPHEADYGIPLSALTFGAIVGRVELLDCTTIGAIKAGSHDIPTRYPWAEDHPHAEGPYCWILGYAVRFPAPIPCRGYQQLWEYSGELP